MATTITIDEELDLKPRYKTAKAFFKDYQSKYRDFENAREKKEMLDQAYAEARAGKRFSSPQALFTDLGI